ncbi:MAG TPA: NahK/ErcS family hybrid sensor histidine kinase/response regulator [Aliidongia sp.]|uniref:hybrid sensor histidine kinase/response regulator n=1 Tax=Aliidongia sp. TaxID=1914230 RepID=UPI002DDD0830|nr:NahK/ErcS family hybrid sensor histidine kinase/response regulator [Aliidongia sp.]HEV2677439.1 NahK/ErcS family hybrid sensor histidine kinase/response regulator [Aliidongia sp.]
MTPSDEARQIAELERKVAKLERINQVLIDRVERSMDGQGSAFSLFQTAIVLEAQIRARTLALERTLADLEQSYHHAARAQEQAETARLRLLAAIESISEGFALFDAADRLVLFNQRYLTFWPGMADRIHTGMLFTDIVHLAIDHKCVLDAYRDPEGWIDRRMQQHADSHGPSVHALGDGRWMQVNEKRTRDGGIVGIYTDITNLKRAETQQREAELAQKTNLLQATLDNIFQGVAVYDRHLALVAWNNEFVRLLDLTPACVADGARFDDLRVFNRSLGKLGIGQQRFLNPEEGAVPLSFEQAWHSGRILYIDRNPMPDGGFVLTFTDITRRKRTEEALRDGERRIRLVTDAMPALIAYVDAEERYQFVNEPYRQWLDRPVDQILGRKMGDLVTAELYDRRKDFVDRALAGEVVDFEVELTPSGTREPRYGHVSFVPHLGDERQSLGFFTLMQDITERRQADAAVKEANETLERRVVERTAALTRLNAQLKHEIADRREIEKALQIAKSEAEQANLGKTRFLAAASHDLLQPLNAARLFVSALADLDHSKPNRGLINNVEISLSAVEDLLAALLDISKLDAGAVQPELVDFPITSLLGPLATEHRALAEDRGLALRHVSSRAVVRSDVRLLRSIIQNFLSNAIRYTRKGRIVLGCRRCSTGLRIEVWDTGAGIPADKFDEIFEEFRQLDTAGGHDRGIGLGLAIVKRAAKTLDLPIEVRSLVGRGSVFSVTVPIGHKQPATVHRSATRRPPGRFADPLLLVIDDQRSILAGMQAMLEGWGCTAVVAASGEEALAQLAGLTRPPDLVIADYHLGDGATGAAEIIRIRQTLGTSVPGIIITANNTPAVQAVVQQHGLRLLRKPLNPAQLRALLSQLLA